MFPCLLPPPHLALAPSVYPAPPEEDRGFPGHCRTRPGSCRRHRQALLRAWSVLKCQREASGLGPGAEAGALPAAYEMVTIRTQSGCQAQAPGVSGTARRCWGSQEKPVVALSLHHTSCLGWQEAWHLCGRARAGSEGSRVGNEAQESNHGSLVLSATDAGRWGTR